MGRLPAEPPAPGEHRPTGRALQDRAFGKAISHPDGIIQLCPLPINEPNQKLAAAYCFWS
jgi:hypothetical protein